MIDRLKAELESIQSLVYQLADSDDDESLLESVIRKIDSVQELVDEDMNARYFYAVARFLRSAKSLVSRPQDLGARLDFEDDLHLPSLDPKTITKPILVMMLKPGISEKTVKNWNNAEDGFPLPLNDSKRNQVFSFDAVKTFLRDKKGVNLES